MLLVFFSLTSSTMPVHSRHLKIIEWMGESSGKNKARVFIGNKKIYKHIINGYFK